MMTVIIGIIIIFMRSPFVAEYFPIYVSWHQQVDEAPTLFGVPYCQVGVMSCPSFFLSCRSFECELKQRRQLAFNSTLFYLRIYPCGQSRVADIQAKR